MMKRYVAIALLVFLSAFRTASGEETGTHFLYALSDFTGTIPYSWVKLFVDKKTDEVYVANSAERAIRVFNDSGMEIYSFGDDMDFGGIMDLVMDDAGRILVLSYNAGTFSVTACNYRGEALGKIDFTGFPPAVATEFYPSVIAYQEGELYLVDKNSMRVVRTDRDGRFLSFQDLGLLLKLDPKKRVDSGIVGFSVDSRGTMYVTVPTLFQAYVISREGTVQGFGSAGSTPGRFNIVGGIDVDGKGNIYVVDTLRCVVMIFNPDFSFRTEFGYRGDAPGNLLAPMDIVVNKERIYVTQSRNRGISVFRISGI